MLSNFIKTEEKLLRKFPRKTGAWKISWCKENSPLTPVPSCQQGKVVLEIEGEKLLKRYLRALRFDWTGDCFESESGGVSEAYNRTISTRITRPVPSNEAPVFEQQEHLDESRPQLLTDDRLRIGTLVAYAIYIIVDFRARDELTINTHITHTPTHIRLDLTTSRC